MSGSAFSENAITTPPPVEPSQAIRCVAFLQLPDRCCGSGSIANFEPERALPALSHLDPKTTPKPP